MVKLFNHYCLFSTHVLTMVFSFLTKLYIFHFFMTHLLLFFSFYNCVRVISNNQTTDSALCYLEFFSTKEICLLCFNKQMQILGTWEEYS